MDLHTGLNETTFELDQAILVYKESGYGMRRRALASVHPVREDAGASGEDPTRPRIGTGRPITTGDVQGLARKLGTEAAPEFLPERVLASTPNLLVWHRRVGRAPLFFDSKSEKLSALSGTELPCPGLVFRLSRKGTAQTQDASMSVWARRERGRPGPSTILYHAPFFNVAMSGSLCHGTMRCPDRFGPSAIGAWEDAFFRSAFTHGTGVRFLKGKPSYADTLAQLAKTEARFPTERLVRTGKRLRDVIRS